MNLSDAEKDMLAGARGEPLRRALAMQVEAGRYFGAERMVPVASAHLGGEANMMGEAGVAFLEELAAQEGRFCVPSTYNACGVDFDNWEALGLEPGHVERERRVIGALQTMGMLTVLACNNYQIVSPPRFGQHLAWGDTGAVSFANSVVGARSNFEGGPAAVAAALTGRVPAYGYHLDEQRRGTFLVEVRDRLAEWADWGALGCWIGRRRMNYWDVPVIVADEANPGVDDLKHLCASLASYGSFPLFHLVGVTPEARTVREAFAGREPDSRLVVESGALGEVYASFAPARSEADLVVFSAPQLSIHEVEEIARRIEGRRIHARTRLILTMSPPVKAEAQRLGIAERIERAGGMLSAGNCFYVMTPHVLKERHGWHTIVTNSAKLANIIEGSGYNPVLRRLDICLEAAASGRIPGEAA